MRTAIRRMVLVLAACGVLGGAAAPAVSAHAPRDGYYRCYVEGYGWMYCKDA